MDTQRGVRTADSLPSDQVAPVGDLVLDPLLGDWYATDLAADGLVRLVLGAADGRLTIRAFGAGDPDPQDWGEVPAEAFGAAVTATTAMAFSAVYRFDFLTVVLAAYGKQGILVVDTFNTFTDSSPRSNYFSREFFHR
jgi:hypothetical protein